MGFLLCILFFVLYISTMLKAIIFDLSEVLLRGLLGTEDYLKETYGLEIENSKWKIKELEHFFHGQITEEEYWAAVVKEYHLPLSVDQLKAAVRSNFKEIEGTRNIIISLKEKGYKLGLLSVHTKEWVEYCEEKLGYHQLFDSTMYSFEVSVSKPDTKAYQLILEKLQIQPNEGLFIDDTLINVEAASQLGIQALQFFSASQLKKDIQNLGINMAKK